MIKQTKILYGKGFFKKKDFLAPLKGAVRPHNKWAGPWGPPPHGQREESLRPTRKDLEEHYATLAPSFPLIRTWTIFPFID